MSVADRFFDRMMGPPPPLPKPRRRSHWRPPSVPAETTGGGEGVEADRGAPTAKARPKVKSSMTRGKPKLSRSPPSPSEPTASGVGGTLATEPPPLPALGDSVAGATSLLPAIETVVAAKLEAAASSAASPPVAASGGVGASLSLYERMRMRAQPPAPTATAVGDDADEHEI